MGSRARSTAGLPPVSAPALPGTDAAFPSTFPSLSQCSPVQTTQLLVSLFIP